MANIRLYEMSNEAQNKRDENWVKAVWFVFVDDSVYFVLIEFNSLLGWCPCFVLLSHVFACSLFVSLLCVACFLCCVSRRVSVFFVF